MVPSPSWKCPKCGLLNFAAAMRCRRCATAGPITSSPDEPASPVPPAQDADGLPPEQIFGLLGICCLALAGLSWWIFGQWDQVGGAHGRVNVIAYTLYLRFGTRGTVALFVVLAVASFWLARLSARSTARSARR